MNSTGQLCDVRQAFAMQTYPRKPLLKRLFNARLGIAFALALIAGAFLAGCDTQAAEIEDAEALNSREWAGQQVCGPAATAVWHGNALECLRERTPVVNK